jgi:hypothetical protein
MLVTLNFPCKWQFAGNYRTLDLSTPSLQTGSNSQSLSFSADTAFSVTVFQSTTVNWLRPLVSNQRLTTAEAALNCLLNLGFGADNNECKSELSTVEISSMQLTINSVTEQLHRDFLHEFLDP